MTSKLWILPLLGLAALGACAPQPQRITLQQPSGPPTGVEGVYRGTARLIRSDNRYCPHSGPRSYQVKNGAVTLAYQGAGRQRVPLTAPIQSNGDFDISDGEGRLQGHAADGALTMTIASQYCEHYWTMRLVN